MLTPDTHSDILQPAGKRAAGSAGNTHAVIISKRLFENVENPRKRRPGLSLDASSLIMKMMAREPEDRFAGAQKLLDAIDAIVNAKPVSTIEEVAPSPIKLRHVTPRRKQASKAPAIAIIGALAIVIGVIIATTSGWFSSEPAPQRDAAGEAFQAAVEYMKSNPADVEGSIRLFDRIKDEYPGSNWAQQAAVQIQQLDAEKQVRTIDAEFVLRVEDVCYLP